MIPDLPNLSPEAIRQPSLPLVSRATHPPRILLLYGSLRERSYSRFATLEAERLLRHFGCETRVFHANGLPLPDDAEASHLKVQELRELCLWSEGQVWTSPERHGAMTGVMKSQIDWIPLSMGAIRPTQGRTLALMQVSGGSQSFNAVTLANRAATALAVGARSASARGRGPRSARTASGGRTVLSAASSRPSVPPWLTRSTASRTSRSRGA